jgi:hypothetical protein
MKQSNTITAMTSKRVHFRYMDAAWSCFPETLATLHALIEDEKPFSLEDCSDVRILKKAPANTPALVGRTIYKSS